jgi:hypothetical protein
LRRDAPVLYARPVGRRAFLSGPFCILWPLCIRGERVSIKLRLIVMNFLQFFVWGSWLLTIGAYWFQN